VGFFVPLLIVNYRTTGLAIEGADGLKGNRNAPSPSRPRQTSSGRLVLNFAPG